MSTHSRQVMITGRILLLGLTVIGCLFPALNSYGQNLVDIPGIYILHPHDKIQLAPPLRPWPCHDSLNCHPDATSITLDSISGQMALFTLEGTIPSPRQEKITLGKTIYANEGGLAFTLTDLKETEATLTIFHNLERKKLWLFLSSNYGKPPLTIQFQAWTLKGDYHLDFGDGNNAIMPQCPRRAGHCLDAVSVSHTYTVSGRFTVRLIDRDGLEIDHWPITVVSPMVDDINSSPLSLVTFK